MSSRVIVSALCLVLVSFGATGLAAGQNSGSGSATSLSPWKAADQMTVGGVITELLATKPAGAPGGLNFVMTGMQRALTVNVGRDVNPKLKDLLKVGGTVRVTGVMRSFGGHDYLLARELAMGGQTIELRNANGFPIRAMGTDGARQPRHVESDLQGGAR